MVENIMLPFDRAYVLLYSAKVSRNSLSKKHSNNSTGEEGKFIRSASVFFQGKRSFCLLDRSACPHPLGFVVAAFAGGALHSVNVFHSVYGE